MKMTLRRWIVRITLLPLGLLIACGRQSPTSSKTRNDTVEYEGADGTRLTANGEGISVPKDWPRDIPFIKGAKVTMAFNQPHGQMLSYETEKLAPEALRFYETSMTDAGWKMTRSDASEGSGIGAREFSKDTRKCQITATEFPRYTSIQIALKPE